LLVAAIILMTVGVGVIFATSQVIIAIQRFDTYLAGGAATTVVRAPGAIDAQRCAALGDTAGVRGSVALREEPAGAVLDVLPSITQPRFSAAGDLPRTLGSDPVARPGVMVSEEFAQRLGLAPGDEISLKDGATLLAGTYRYPDDGRLPLLASAVIVPVPAGATPFDQCWVTVWPPREDFRSMLTSVLIASDAAQTETQLLGSTLGAPQTLASLISASPAVWLQAGAAAVALILGVVWVRTRRVELALALHLGQSRAALHTQSVLEAALVGIPVAAAGLALTTTLIAAQVNPTHAPAAALGATATTVAILAALLSGVLIGAQSVRASKISDWAKDR